MPDHGLSPENIAILRRIFACFAGRIERVDLFGSRATGKFRPNSDIDLAIHGDLTVDELARLRGMFEESSLPVSVDAVLYGTIAHPPLKEHIDRVAMPLFTRKDLALPPMENQCR